jgi:hypothetical protein
MLSYRRTLRCLRTMLPQVGTGGLRLRFAFSKGPNRVCVSPSHLRTETDPVSEMLYFIAFRIPDDGQSAETQ